MQNLKNDATGMAGQGFHNQRCNPICGRAVAILSNEELSPAIFERTPLGVTNQIILAEEELTQF